MQCFKDRPTNAMQQDDMHNGDHGSYDTLIQDQMVMPYGSAFSKLHGKIQEVPNAYSGIDTVAIGTVETGDSNVIPDSPDMCDNDIQDGPNESWVKHSNDLLHLRNPTAQDMEILVKTCLMPLALKTQNDSFAFVHELKQEMHADLKYNVCLKMLCVISSSDLDEITELQCLYLHKVRECDCLAQKLSEQTEFVICKDKASNVFRKEREQYFEIQDLKAQLQDKNIAISELKKLIEKCKGKSVETQFDKPSVVRQPNAQRIPKPSVLGKPTPFQIPPEVAYTVANHDESSLENTLKLNPRASAQNKDAKSHKTTKRYMPVEKSSASKKPERQIPIGHRFLNKKTTTVPEKTMNPRSCLRWKPTGRIFKTIGLRWVPTGKISAFSTNKVLKEKKEEKIVEPQMVQKKISLTNVKANKLLMSVQCQNGFTKDELHQMTSVHNSSGLAPPRQMTFDHNSSELGIHDHNNELSSSKLVPKVVPLADKTMLSSQAVNKSPTHYPCDSARTFRVILFSIHNDEWKSFQCHHQTALRFLECVVEENGRIHEDLKLKRRKNSS
ncbi:hypothetical protein Tco_0823580 [Tanacetum coccineum]|uniref:Uncharacterized protein n=2 Tax=Tanacetum coccineum TaxID=301880 RepID=A0ABQ5AJA6_9ASTR